MVKGREVERVRLYVRGTILGYKRVAYIYMVMVKTNGSHYRCIWGKVIRPHGNNGVVRAKFTSNLPPKSMCLPNYDKLLILICMNVLMYDLIFILRYLKQNCCFLHCIY
ncbi:hypothetical protein MKW94_024442 [Papaver nudicaule]|uniref:Ribosomal protein L35A n=1 Tax=Papaver nudicaule TaxID=74823 RepID=A0AA41S6F4_PAPNU|nr:hypothetical protein [Papaver nudicaule]